ncbi:CHAD domain-containing protein [Rhodoferax sp.]|uniref:CYTH and CHAD domain-containing protein n=1 Tax=Rhodoferax sp. TaxID=50421 RepID=UPI00284B01F7|nr:CHAD domain-containing protein [Rhodoferax sp.]MDR3370417.1 CHAD domain-containing protein [Rhodoferax sp.]
MKPDQLQQNPTEIELKLALVASDVRSLSKHLAGCSPLQAVKPARQSLHSVYFDTPDQRLQQMRVALRIRRVGKSAKAARIQTLKTSCQNDSALSSRGEWESKIPGDTLSLAALQNTAWPQIDPDGHIFAALAPSFATRFDRTKWTVAAQDGGVVEVAFDLGEVQANGQSSVICELELELLSGESASLFTVAQQLAEHVAVIPLSQSKAARGHALAQGTTNQPQYARPPVLKADSTLHQVAQQVLREMFSQFTANLDTLRRSDDPEVVHQARVGWRRFKSALRLFKPVLHDQRLATDALKPLLTILGELRDLEVAVIDTLPPLADAYTGSDPQRSLAWQALTDALKAGADNRRTRVREAMRESTVGACLLAITRFIEELPLQGATDTRQHHAASQPAPSVQPWARRRFTRFRQQLKLALADTRQPGKQHLARIFAKRLRYATEALQPFLPKRRSRRWLSKATELQTRFGQSRDIRQALALATQYQGPQIAPEVIEFLRGYVLGAESQASTSN